MIKIITQAKVGVSNGKYIVVKSQADEPFEADKDIEADLVHRGIAEYVDKPEMDESDEADESETDEDETLDYLKSLKLSELKEMGEAIGVKYSAGTLKHDYAEEIWRAQNGL